MEPDDMNDQSPRPSGERLERELEALLGTAPHLPEARLQRVRGAVFERLARPHPALPQWLQWRTAVPAAAALLLLGGALGWNLGERLEDGPAADLAGTLMTMAPGGL